MLIIERIGPTSCHTLRPSCTQFHPFLAFGTPWPPYLQKEKLKVKVRQSVYRSGKALRVPGGWGSQFSRQSTHEGGKVVSHKHQSPLPPLPPENILGTHFCDRPSRPDRPEILCQWKIPVTPSGIKHATFRFVAQCLNQLRSCVSREGRVTGTK
jgi:hypothetical protein